LQHYPVINCFLDLICCSLACMDQVISALNELHQRAASAIGALQQGNSSSWSGNPRQQQHWLANRTSPAVAGSWTENISSSSSNGGSSSKSCTTRRQRVHFAPPFAALSPLGRAGGDRLADGASKKQKKQQEEEEERILISEVGALGHGMSDPYITQQSKLV
jgi:hypothetical protein